MERYEKELDLPHLASVVRAVKELIDDPDDVMHRAANAQLQLGDLVCDLDEVAERVQAATDLIVEDVEMSFWQRARDLLVDPNLIALMLSQMGKLEKPLLYLSLYLLQNRREYYELAVDVLMRMIEYCRACGFEVRVELVEVSIGIDVHGRDLLVERAARDRLHECLLQSDAGSVPQATVQHQFQYDGLDVEHLSWQLPYGPPTEAVFLAQLSHD